MNISDLLTHLGAMAITALALFYYLTRERGQRESVETELSFVRTELEESKSKSALLEEELKKSVEAAGALNAEKASLESSIKEKATALADRDSRISGFEMQIRNLNSQVTEKESLLSRLETTIEQERRSFEENWLSSMKRKKGLETSSRTLETEFSRIRRKKFTDKNKADMENLLNPLREQIKDFERKVTDTHEKATTDRASSKFT